MATSHRPAQHQLLLAIRGHHSAVELMDRAAGADLVVRRADPDDTRTVRVPLSAHGRERLEALAAFHLEELGRLTGRLHTLWVGLDSQC